MDVRRRIVEFDKRLAMAQAGEVRDMGWGYALLQADYPESWQHNRIVVTGPVATATLIAAAEDILGGAGLTHRRVDILDDAFGKSMAEPFAAAGYDIHEQIITMTYAGPLPPRETPHVTELSFAEARPTYIEDWRAQFPDSPPEAIARLADRTQLIPRGAHLTLLGARDEAGTVVAKAELYQADGVAQFENLTTRPEARRRGYARELITEALHRSHTAEINILTAEATDWPRTWYRRLGYRDSHHVHQFTLPD